MTFIWFIFGIALITLIARYNESNALFWKLFLSFILGIAVASLVTKCNSNNEQNEEVLAQVSPMQVSDCMPSNALYLLADIDNPMSTNESSNPVGKVQTSVTNENFFISSEVLANSRDQPQLNSKPPERCLVKSILIRLSG